ncbi:hypothetical protein Bpfe_026361 [Biomphalaria pfeifferi]|uniref:Uncharacterized protein n=1 Tax=Biomphalaria pfeifferi TaxID=112525 RepID=A0AAD8AYK9_BIOPF|nr:hypothetical protein Bpfe_026361 [Biomphalaria pfeifferi]
MQEQMGTMLNRISKQVGTTLKQTSTTLIKTNKTLLNKGRVCTGNHNGYPGDDRAVCHRESKPDECGFHVKKRDNCCDCVDDMHRPEDVNVIPTNI